MLKYYINARNGEYETNIITFYLKSWLWKFLHCATRNRVFWLGYQSARDGSTT